VTSRPIERRGFRPIEGPERSSEQFERASRARASRPSRRDRPPRSARRRRVSAPRRAARGRFSAAALADDPTKLACVDREGRSLDRIDAPAAASIPVAPPDNASRRSRPRGSERPAAGGPRRQERGLNRPVPETACEQRTQCRRRGRGARAPAQRRRGPPPARGREAAAREMRSARPLRIILVVQGGKRQMGPVSGDWRP
jgi:hypothetical protein